MTVADQDGLNLAFMHVVSISLLVGSSVFFSVILLPISQSVLSQGDYYKLLGRIIKRFHPLLLLCYGLALMSGLWILTRYKIVSGVNYFQEYGNILIAKFSLAFAAIMVSCYQFFGLGTGIVYAMEEGLDTADFPKKIRLMRMTSGITIAIFAALIYLGLALSRV